MNVGDTVSDNDTGQIWLIGKIYPSLDEYYLERTISNYTTINIKMDYNKLIMNYTLVNLIVPELPIGKGNGISLKELDEAYDNFKKNDIHKDHEIVTNWAANKEFQYCRNCKKEV